MENSVRHSSYGDYIAVDLINEGGKITSTPFYIKEGKTVEVWWSRPSAEQCDYPVTSDDWYDKYDFKMQNGKLFVRWKNGPCFGKGTFRELMPLELSDWKFQYARKIISE